VKPAQKRAVVQFLRVGLRVSERRACQVASVPRSSCRSRSQAQDQSPLRQRLWERAAVRARYGYRRLHVVLRREDWSDIGDPGVSYRESLALFGYPISEEFTDPATGLTTQYFERARFEFHPHNPEPFKVELGRLGADKLSQWGW
jgi:hypothetical protein